jgi:hypothetical protein
MNTIVALRRLGLFFFRTRLFVRFVSGVLSENFAGPQRLDDLPQSLWTRSGRQRPGGKPSGFRYGRRFGRSLKTAGIPGGYKLADIQADDDSPALGNGHLGRDSIVDEDIMLTTYSKRLAPPSM